MTSDVEALKGLMPSGTPVSTQLMTVAAVRDDGLLNLAWGEAIFAGIPADSTYTNRQPGDVVLVLKHDAGWRALPPAGAPVAVGDVATTVTRWGAGPPAGSGWQQATQMWVRDGEVYAQLAGAPSVPPTAPTNSPKKTVSPTGDAMYSGGHRAAYINGGHAVQGGYRSNPNNRGIWIYGSRITDACAGKTVTKMQVRLTRRASGGRSGGVRPQLYLHTYSTAPYDTPYLTDAWSPSEALGWGEGHTYTLPDNWTNALAAGGRAGIGCNAPNGNNGYLLYTASSGAITITFD